MKKIFVTLVSIAMFLCTFGTANAALVTTGTSGFVAITPTNFTDVGIDVDYFDSDLGDLVSIDITLFGEVLGSVMVESQDAQASVITYSLQATVSLERPLGGAYLVTVLPAGTGTFNATAYDGTLDFGGTSGTSITGLGGTDTDWNIFTDPTDLALFSQSGGGTLTLDLSAAGLSTASGAGNLFSSFSTQAGGSVEIIYTYDDGSEVPEPASFLLFGVGLLGFTGVLRRKINKN